MGVKSSLRTLGETPVGDCTVDIYDDTLNAEAYIASRRTFRYSGKDATAASALARRDYRRATGCESRLNANWFPGRRERPTA